MTIQEFHQLCSRHDWNYQYSDDHSVWKRSQGIAATLSQAASADPACALLLKSWRLFRNGKGPRPELEKEPA